MHEGHLDHHHEDGGENAAKQLALLAYMAGHNRHHAEELKTLAHNLEHMGGQAAADLINRAEGYLSKGTDLLFEAAELLKKSTEGGGH